MGTSRILVEMVIWAFREGSSPEQIARDYPSATMVDIYGVIAYSLRLPDEIAAYLERRERQAREIRAKLDASGMSRDLNAIRQRLAPSRA